MVTRMYSVFDAKAGVYGTPFFSPQDAMAVRAFADLANDLGTLVGKHPEDFTLFTVGHFDDETGQCSVVNPAAIVTASQVRRPVHSAIKEIGERVAAEVTR